MILFRKTKNDESYLLDPEKKVKRYDNIMKNNLDDMQSSSSGSNKDDEDSFLTLSTKIVTLPSTPTICYFQMVECNKDQTIAREDRKKLSIKEKWQQSKFKSLVR